MVTGQPVVRPDYASFQQAERALDCSGFAHGAVIPEFVFVNANGAPFGRNYSFVGASTAGLRK